MAKKTYKQKSDLYKDQAWTERAEMAVREAALVYSLEDSPEKRHDKLLANGVLSNSSMDIGAVVAGMVHSPTAEASINDDAAMQQAVHDAWAFVAPARYPETMVTPEIKITSLVPPPNPMASQLREGVIENLPPGNPDRSQEGIAPAPTEPPQ